MFHFNFNTEDCPVCKSSLRFSGRENNLKVCETCNSLIERREASGIAKVLRLPVNRRQYSNLVGIGTKGIFNNKRFEVTGCQHCDMRHYKTHRYTIVWEDGSSGQLSETLGFYSIGERISVDYPSKLYQLKGIELGTEMVELIKGRQHYILEKATCEGTEISGEISSPDTDGQFKVVELGDKADNRIEVIEYKTDHRLIYWLHYVPVESLQLSNAPLQKITPLQKKCGGCDAQITLKLPQYSRYAVCSSCGKWNELNAQEQFQLKDKKVRQFHSPLPIGSKGRLHGMELELTGAMEKYESGSVDTTWREYCFWGEKAGFVFLAEYNGHFTLLKEVKLGQPWPFYLQEITIHYERYVLFNDYTFFVNAAAGEFFLPTENGSVQAKEYISPPEMYAAEKSGNREITWFHGEHISAKEVYEGLGLVELSLPARSGVGPLETPKGYVNPGLLFKMTFIAIAILLGIEIFFSAAADGKVVYEQQLYFDDSIPAGGIVTPSFELSRSSSNLNFVLSSPVNNSWFEADIVLVNDKNGREYNINKGIEYYEGYAEGEHWTEGAKEAEALLSAIPKGTYHLNIFPSAGGAFKVQGFYIRVYNDVPMWRNFFFMVIFALLFPVIQWLRMHLFERRRWNNSPYNPYQSKEE